ncbi:MAG: hypothetical protein ACT4P7_19000 [Gemmatimonadaceae bacterium]
MRHPTGKVQRAAGGLRTRGAMTQSFGRAGARETLHGAPNAAPSAETLLWSHLIDVIMSEVPQPWWAAAAATSTRSPAGPRVPPLLDGTHVAIDGARLNRLVERLLHVANADGHGMRPPESHVMLDLVRAALCQDGRIAEPCPGSSAAPLRSVAHLASLPLLNACLHAWQHHMPKHWSEGWCSLCGAWPVIAEIRGLERARRLRCGRCAADWSVPWLQCIFCGERQHQHLGHLVCGGETNHRKVDTCTTCRGYLKSVPTLLELSFADLLRMDAETLPLDLAALEAQFHRPNGPARPIGVTLEVSA